MARQIKTIIKFKKGEGGINNGKVYGFVTKQNGHWKGCRDTDECKKKIVFVDPRAYDDILINTPYNATLIPMRSEQGFIATAISPVQFEGKIITKVNRGEFKVLCKFGMKTIVYDPTSEDPKFNRINDIANVIRHRQDLKDAAMVAEDFIDSACIVKSMYNRQCS